MTGPVPPTRAEELLLARITAAAGREHLGKRRGTYTGVVRPASPKGLWDQGIGVLLTLARHLGSSAADVRDEARLDLYENGMTAAVKGLIHVVRYDTTSVFRTGAASHALTGVDGERIVLRDGPGQDDASQWWAEIERGVTRAQLPRALAALGRGERLAFGSIRLTREEIGCGKVRARWPQVRDLRIRQGALVLDTVDATSHDATSHELDADLSRTPNLFVLRALVERLGRDGRR
ncbi:DUF6585 family protein [Streptomyces sp. NPDC049555]|uniref:DUF6585 family protein n=1 Tax=Streptomyces sp. NPDC049555 TaxID=3154930 RepID=UPI00342B6BC5